MGRVFRRSGAVVAGGALVLASGVVGSSPAAAACDPAAASGVTATCSGVTNNQNAPNGYGTGNENDVTVNVLPGATLTGTNFGIFLGNDAAIGNSGSITGSNDGIRAGTITSLTNSGSITGGNDGILAITITSLANSGSITGGVIGIDANTITNLTNSGSVTGDTRGIFASTITGLGNSGFITGGNFGIDASIIQSLGNSGSITGGIVGIFATTITSLSNSGSIIGNTAEGIDAHTITNLTNSGSITGDSRGIDAFTITSLGNSGSITGGSTGISAGTIQNLANSGSITGTIFEGISALTIQSLSNSGSITGATRGISATTITSLANSGLIAGGQYGIVTSLIQNLGNSGSIAGNDFGINATTITSLVNSGSITGTNIVGINAGNLTSLFNSGSIAGNDFGINATTITNLTNSGLIAGGGVGDFAIREHGAGNTQLTLLAGSVLVGQVDLGGGVNTLNVGKGLSMATTFTGATPVIGSMSVPFVVNGNQVVTADTTNLANHSTMLADLTGGIFSTVENRMDNLRGGILSFAQPMVMAYAADTAAASGPWVGFGSGGADGSRQVWIQAFGSYRQQQGTSTTLDSQLATGGFVSGMDIGHAGGRAGIFLGGSAGASVIDLQAGKTTSDSFFGGAYSSTQVGRGFVDLAFVAGYSSFDRERRVANNLVAGGVETATADYHGWFVSPQIRFVQPAGSLEGSLTLRYAGLFLDGFAESGVTAGALAVGSQDIHLGIVRAALSLPLTKTYSDGAVARWIWTGGVEGRTQFGGDNFSGTLAGQGIAFSAGGRDSTVGLFGAYRAEFASPLGHTVFAAVEGIAEQDGSFQLSGKAGFRVRY